MESKALRALTMIAAVTVCGVAGAQQMPLDGSRPPVVSIADATKGQASPVNNQFVEQASSATPAGQSMPSGAVASPTDQGVIADVINRTPPAPKPKRSFRAPPSSIAVESGQNSTYGIAKDHINRIVTPFARPTLRTTSTASTSIEGSIVYLATPNETPVSLFIFDEGAPEFAISLTLVPQEMAPVSTTVTVNGWSDAGAATRRPGSTAQALATEGQHPYLETLTTLLRDIAKGRIPDGYGYEALPGYPVAGTPSCSIPGVHVQPMQVLSGGAFKVIVAKATNTSYSHADIREDLCTGRELRAVSAWPSTSLSPGQSTELYMVVGTYADPYDAATRPSVLGSN